METICIFPPSFIEVHKPYGSLPLLLGYLKGVGKDVLGVDANIEFYNYLISKEGLRELKNEVDLCYKYILSQDEIKGNDMLKYHIISWMNASSVDDIYMVADELKNILKSERYYNFEEYSSAERFFSGLFKVIDVLMYSNEDKFDLAPYNDKNELLDIVEERKYNPYKSYYEEKLIPRIIEKDTKYIDITIDFTKQLLPGLYLAKKIKDIYGHKVFITFSGDVCPRLKQDLSKMNYLFKYVDSIILNDREEIINKVIENIEDDKVKDICNLAYFNNGEVQVNKVIPMSCIENWKMPDYSDMPLDLYFAPKIEFTVMSSYGCYWRKCKFCNIYLKCLEYGEKQIKDVVDDIENLCEKFDAKIISFGDEEIKASRLLEMSKELIRRNIKVNWTAQVRFEEYLLNPDVARCYKEAGCCYLGFGLESGSDSELKSMDTGTNTSLIVKILKNIKNAKIAVNVSLVIGFIGETDENWKETINFLRENNKLIDSILPLPYSLTKGSIIDLNRKSYGIKKVYDEEKLEYVNIDYPNYIDVTPNWKTRETRYGELLKLINENSQMFSMSFLPKLLYEDFFKTTDASVLQEKMYKYMSSADKEEKKITTYKLNKRFTLFESAFDMNLIKSKLKYNFSGNLPLKEVEPIKKKKSFYIIDIVNNLWREISEFHYNILKELVNGVDVKGIAEKLNVDISKVEANVTLVKILYKNIFKKENV
ncbi:radical SAM protein [uncultured Clostridium sp.]|uniref:B12-binding domain-containing radical SAM protein n=1 Tax=uncultured Clostridium sp. TaxID=59620 RepID=UPI0025DD0D62|nr:radical SAM protein [uncultured Clostridium sp.]